MLTTSNISLMPGTLDTTGKRIRVLRGDLELTQAELTRQLAKLGIEINQSYISTLETTNKTPSGEIIRGLAEVLQTTTDYLLLRTDDPLLPGEEDLTPEEQDLLRSLDEIADSDRPLVFELLQSIADTWLRRRPRQNTRIRGAQVLRVPRSRDDLAAVWPQLPKEDREKLVSLAEEMIRKTERTDTRPTSER